MAKFSNAPPTDPRGIALQLLRTPAKSNIRCIVTGDDLLGCFTHYFKGRTLPCDPDNCEACEAGRPYRWHAWLSALTARQHQHIIFEMTAQAAEPFVAYRQANGTLRGALFDAARPSGRPNGRVVIQIKSTDLTGIELPTAPDMLKCLSIIWNIPTPAMDVGSLLKQVPRLNVHEEAAESLHAGNGQAKDQ